MSLALGPEGGSRARSSLRGRKESECARCQLRLLAGCAREGQLLPARYFFTSASTLSPVMRRMVNPYANLKPFVPQPAAGQLSSNPAKQTVIEKDPSRDPRRKKIQPVLPEASSVNQEATPSVSSTSGGILSLEDAHPEQREEVRAPHKHGSVTPGQTGRQRSTVSCFGRFRKAVQYSCQSVAR